MAKEQGPVDYDAMVASLLEKKQKGFEFILGGITFETDPYIFTGDYAELFTNSNLDDSLFLYNFLISVVSEDQKDDLEKVLTDKDKKIPNIILKKIVEDASAYLGKEK